MFKALLLLLAQHIDHLDPVGGQGVQLGLELRLLRVQAVGLVLQGVHVRPGHGADGRRRAGGHGQRQRQGGELLQNVQIHHIKIPAFLSVRNQKSGVGKFFQAPPSFRIEFHRESPFQRGQKASKKVLA